MLKSLTPALLFFLLLLISSSAADHDFARCNCEEDGLWSVDSILECQRVSDFLIAIAYFSIPIELLCFVSCSNVPFKWVLLQFIAFIVLCGLTHLLNSWTYGPHTFQLMLALTVFKFLTALVSCATAITLVTLIPLLLKVKMREFMLKKKAWDLGREVGLLRRHKETGYHVRMLTQEIRKSLDRHTILYTTMVELSKTLELQCCAVWMPDENKTSIILTHELKGKSLSNVKNHSVPIYHPDVVKIKGSPGVNILSSGSPLVSLSGVTSLEPVAAAAIRMPMLRISNFKGGTPEQIQTYYSILVLILPGERCRTWNNHELEIVKVVSDQVAVALSHAAVLEESQYMREKLEAQNRALQQAKRNTMMASQATNSFQKVMSNGMRRPMHSILGLLSLIVDGRLNDDQRIIIDAMAKNGSVLSTLINDTMDISHKHNERSPLVLKTFSLHSTIKEIACVAKCLCIYNGFGFALEAERALPECVVGDEIRVFQVILHMLGSLLKNGSCGTVMFQVSSSNSSGGWNNQGWKPWGVASSDGYLNIKFEMRMNSDDLRFRGLDSTQHIPCRRRAANRVGDSLSFTICRRLTQLMQGNIWVAPNLIGQNQVMGLDLCFQVKSSIGIRISKSGEFSDSERPNPLFRGLPVLLADDDDANRAVTHELLRKLGCGVSPVASGAECLRSLTTAGSPFEVVVLDLHMPNMNGYEAAREIRRSWGWSWPLIIAVTTSADEEVVKKCSQIGINGVVRKPYSREEIFGEIHRVLLSANRAAG